MKAIKALKLVWLGLLAVAAMEFAARVDDYLAYGAPITSNYDFEQMFQYDGTTVRGIPEARYAKWQLNGVGMRGPAPRPDQGQTRILVYGASEAFGIYETPGKEFPRALEQTLNEPRPGRYEVLNAGIPGMRIGSGTAHIQELGRRYAPAYVVLYPTPTHYIGVSRPMCGRPKKAVSGGPRMPASRLAGKLSDRVKEVLPRWALTPMRRLSILWESRNDDVLDRVPDASLAAFETDLNCAIAAVRSIGAQPVVVTHANRFGTLDREDDEYWLVGWRRQYPELKEDGFKDLERRANAVVTGVAQRESVTLVDADRNLSGRSEYFADHAHFTDAGAAAIGELLAREITQTR